MRIISIVVAIAISVAGLAQAQFIGEGVWRSVTSSSYTGPGDIVASALGYWAPNRCYSNAFSGKIVDIVDAATGTTTETVLKCSSGGVIAASVTNADCAIVGTCSALATTCATACVIANLYDQSGNAQTMTQATNSRRPAYIQSGVGTRGVMRCDGSTTRMSASTTSQSQPLNTFATGKYTGSTQDAIFASNSGGYQLGSNDSATHANTAFIFGAVAVLRGTASDNTWHNYTGNMNAGSSILYVDGSNAASGTNIGTIGIGTTSFICSADNTPNNPFHGDVGEVGIWSGTISSTNAASLNTNSKAYFGY